MTESILYRNRLQVFLALKGTVKGNDREHSVLKQTADANVNLEEAFV